jgi:hypothetical protein
LSPGSAGNHLNLGLILVEAGQYEEAARYLRNAITMDPRYAESEVPLNALRELKSHVKLPRELLRLIVGPRRGSKTRHTPADTGQS